MELKSKKLSFSISYPVQLGIAGFEQKLEGLLVVLEEFLERESLLHEKLKEMVKISLSICFCDEETIHSFNKKYRNKDSVTDVLSFPVHGGLRRDDQLLIGGADQLELGDIIICVGRATAQAGEFEVTLENELIHLIIHGFLHLLGFDHEVSDEEQEVMNRLEESLVIKIHHYFR
ncbi:MAG: rRNA maturation RNase YbeY [Bacteriovoracaceae bacterium]|nr:rRNA maturation RNase YbeY [Bacteriovoracaceae bacterium]